MSLFLDTKYVSLLSPKLERFTRKSEYLWNFRCPICGDSHKNKAKARGYIYRQKSNLSFSCHNCGINISLGNLIKAVDRPLHKEYVFDRFKSESAGNIEKPDLSVYKSKPTFPKKEQIALPAITSLDVNHTARRFVENRKIPEQYFDGLFYANDFASFVKDILPENTYELKEDDPRLVIPFYDENKNLLGLQGRALGPSTSKYITIKLTEENDKIFGLDRLDKTKTVYVVEGPLDSLFLNNSIATMDSRLYAIIPVLGALDYVFLYDNEPRNIDINRNMRKTMNLNQKMVVWPQHIVEKDINDMIISGINPIQNIIDYNTFQGPRAFLEYTRWSKIY